MLVENAITENMFAQVYGEENRHVLFQEVINHRYSGNKVNGQDAFITTRNEKKRCRETMQRVEVLVLWKDGSTTWVTFKDTKNSYPLHIAKYEVHCRITDNPEFEWWIRNVLAKRNHIIVKLKSKYWVRTHKSSVKIPMSVQEEKSFDIEN